MRADPSALSLGVTRTAGRRSARCQGVELSKGGGGGAWCSAIRAERAHCFGRYFLSSHEEAQVLADGRLSADGVVGCISARPRTPHMPSTP